MIKAIIFDLDGVLVDTENLHYSCLQQASEHISGIALSDFKQIISIDGKTTKQKLEILKEKFNLSDDEISMIDRVKQAMVMANLKDGVVYQPELPDLIDKLYRDGYKLAIASNSRRENVILILDSIGIRGYFSSVLSNNDIVSPKPSPEIFLKAMEEIGVSYNETIILEDSPVGKYAANKSQAHLLEVGTLSDVSYERIKNEIRRIEQTHNSGSNGGIGI